MVTAAGRQAIFRRPWCRWLSVRSVLKHQDAFILVIGFKFGIRIFFIQPSVSVKTKGSGCLKTFQSILFFLNEALLTPRRRNSAVDLWASCQQSYILTSHYKGTIERRVTYCTMKRSTLALMKPDDTFSVRGGWCRHSVMWARWSV